MLSRTLAVLQSLVFPWNEGHYHPPSQPRPRKKRSGVDDPTVLTKFKFTHRPGGPPQFLPLSPSHHVPPVPPPFLPRKRHKALPSLDTEPPQVPQSFRRFSPSLEDLNVDVFRLIVDQLHQQEVSLQSVALSSRKLRSLCFPILFSRCRVDIGRPERDDPPEAIRAYVRHFTHLGPLDKDGDLMYVENLFSHFPHLTSIALEELRGGIPWAVLKTCLVLPNLVSLSVHLGLCNLRVPLFPQDDIAATPISLKRFSYAITTWREQCNGFTYGRTGALIPRNMQPDFEFERECLSSVVLRLNNTVTSLTLPVESAPILAMAQLPWPHLRELSLHGRFIDPAHAATLQHLLPSLSSLVKLSVLARRLFYRPMQYPLLPKACIPQSSSLQRTGPVSSLQPPDPASSPSFSASFPPPTAATSPPMPRREPSPIPLLSELRSLVIAYPDPEDGLFSLGLHNLTHLSLCDHPRVYHRLVEDGRSLAAVPDRTWPAPLLSPEECLFILRRMDLSRLTSLELVYIAHQPGSDDDLLAYIVESLPRLEHLELHRYRGVRTEMRGIRVDHMHIAQLLSAATSLRTLRLNLDFHDDHQAYCNVSWERERWLPLFKTRGFEIVDLLQASCPHLEHVALLYHGESAATWAEFHPQRCAEPRFVLDYTKDHVDSEPYPREQLASWIHWFWDQ